MVEGVDQHPGAQVLIERLVDLQLLRPLDVVALVLAVDTRLVDVELVEGLHRLQFQKPGSDQPGDDDVLRHLAVRARGNPERGVHFDPVLLDAERIVEAGNEERRARDAEELVLLFQLIKHPIGERLH